VSIFRRGNKPEASQENASSQETEVSPDTESPEAELALGDDAVEAGDAHPSTSDAADDEAADDEAADDEAAGAGPFDAAEIEGEDGRLDLGGLRIMGVAGMELRLEVDEEAGQVVGATAVVGDSAVQLQAFAAPRTMGIWDDIRAEIAESVVAQGGTADEQRGVLGTELRTRMPSAGPDGRTVFAPARFAGVDGPRWFLRAVFSGRAAIDDEAAEPLVQVVRNAVVVRGDAAMAPRELLPLQLPEQLAPDTDEAAAEQGKSAGDLKPFERGPEITEVR
jgi:Protein of unknown function (DUF3710)